MKEKLQNHKTELIYSVISILIWSTLTHFYAFSRGLFTHDSLNEFNAAVFGNDWKIELGRVFTPAYRAITRGDITVPWVIGILTVLYLSAALFLVIQLFEMKSRVQIFIAGGILTANITLIATTATYINDLDSDVFSILMAILAVYLWRRYKLGMLFGMIPLCISLGLYQSNISTTITLIIMLSILDLLEKKQFFTVLGNGMKGIAMILGGGILYWLSLKIICNITGISLNSGDYNSVDTALSLNIFDLIYYVRQGYIETLSNLFYTKSVYHVSVMTFVHIIIFGITAFLILIMILKNKIHLPEILLLVLLIILLPFGMNSVYALTGGKASHDLMHYAVWMGYLFVLGITWRQMNQAKNHKSTVQQYLYSIPIILIVFILWGNIQTANAAYLKKDLEIQANLSLFTRITYDIEKTEGYVPGITPVVFVGHDPMLLSALEGFEDIYYVTGNGAKSVMGAGKPSYYQSYFDNILMNPAVMADDETWDAMSEDSRVKEMPIYPSAGSVQMIDGIVVVKMNAE